MHRAVRVVFSIAIGVAIVGNLASAAPRASASDKYRAAAKLAADDENEKALALVEQGLALAPRDLELLQLKGVLHLKMRDYTAALAAYQAYLDAGAQGANRREAQKIVKNLAAVKSTFLEIAGTERATIYLDSKTYGTLCTTPCKQPMLPGDYKVIAERTGFDRWTGRVTVDQGKTAKVTVALAEQPSHVTVKTPPGARVTLDGKPHDAPGKVAPGKHQLEVALAGHATARLEIVAKEGAPLEIDVPLLALVPLAVAPAGAQLALDDKPVTLDAGGLAIPAGAHVLIAKAPGYHDSRIEIPAERGADYKLAVELQPIGTIVDLAGVPSGAKLYVDGKQVGSVPLGKPFEVPPGAHTIEVRVSGYRPFRAAGTFGADQRALLETDKLVRDNRKRMAIAGAATGVLALTGALFSANALSKETDYNTRARQAGVTPDDPTLNDLRSSGQTSSRIADIAFGAGIVGLGLTTYFFITEGRGESKGSLKIGIGAGGAAVSGRF